MSVGDNAIRYLLGHVVGRHLADALEKLDKGDVKGAREEVVSAMKVIHQLVGR